uniref:T-cell receptor alpha chain constant domain-containing protein n=1 Tax=Panthera leo TaxID=9689 RepID=A0A8C8X599_PANLE
MTRRENNHALQNALSPGNALQRQREISIASPPGLSLSGVSLDIVLKPDTETLTVLVGEPATFRCSITGGDWKNYQVTIQNPDPAVYQLKSPESSNISVCLFTDFDSEINVEPSTESNMTRLKSTSLDMKTMDSKSNGALAWSNSFDLGCNSTFNYTFHSSSEFPCDANVVEKGFETDMNLNFYNLLVIVLRITFLKVVGFNLLMTLRLWSS